MRKSLKKQKWEKTKFKVRRRVHWRKSRVKGLLGVFRCKAPGPYKIHKICEDESIEVKDPRDSKVYSVKSKELRVFPPTEKSSERVYLMLA